MVLPRAINSFSSLGQRAKEERRSELSSPGKASVFFPECTEPGIHAEGDFRDDFRV
jgi:hypothetical protein